MNLHILITDTLSLEAERNGTKFVEKHLLSTNAP